MPAVALLLVALSPAFAATPFGLPQEEQTTSWSRALADVGFEPGAVGGAGAWARLERAAGGCALLVSTGHGAVQREDVACPASEAEREEVAALAAVMAAQLVHMGVPPMPPAPPVPAPTAAPRPRFPAVPAVPAPSARPLAGSAPAAAAPSPAPVAVLPPPSPLPLIVTGPLPSAPSASAPIPAATGVSSAQGAWNVRSCGCVVDFDLPCATTERCSTSERCPRVWFLDGDQDGYSNGATCRQGAEPGRVMRDYWVQVVGDLDDTDPDVHPNP